MSHRKSSSRRKTRAAAEPSATSAPLAFLLRDPHSTDELRRTIAAWSRFIERHLHDEYAEVRVFAQMSIVRRAAAYAILGEFEAALADVQLAQTEAAADGYIQGKALEVKAIVQADQNDHAGALVTFAELWPLLPAINFPPEERAELWLARGKCYGRLHRYEEAISDFTQVLSLDAQSGEACCWRGLAHGFLAHEEEAVSDATQALALQPNNATFYRIRGIILRLCNRFAESLTDLLQAEALPSDDRWIEHNKQETVCKWLLCRGPEAFEEMERVFAQPPARAKEKQAPPPPSKAPNPLASMRSPAPMPTSVPPVASVSINTPKVAPRSRSKRPSASSEQGMFF